MKGKGNGERTVFVLEEDTEYTKSSSETKIKSKPIELQKLGIPRSNRSQMF